MRYERITLEEREEIFRLRYEKRLFLREIGQRLHKNKSSVSRELKRGKKQTIQPNNRRGQSPECEEAAMPEIKDDL